MSNKFPTDFPDKGSADATDKMWSSDGSTNFNLTVDEVGARNFTDRDTDDLTEGSTNKYVSTANVDAAGATMNTDTTLVGNGYFLDEDDMLSNDATKVASQQSIKAYVDNFIVPSATESIEGIAELSDATEASTGTNDTTIMTPKKVRDNYQSTDQFYQGVLTLLNATGTTTETILITPPQGKTAIDSIIVNIGHNAAGNPSGTSVYQTAVTQFTPTGGVDGTTDTGTSQSKVIGVDVIEQMTVSGDSFDGLTVGFGDRLSVAISRLGDDGSDTDAAQTKIFGIEVTWS